MANPAFCIKFQYTNISNQMLMIRIVSLVALALGTAVVGQEPDTLPPLREGVAPQNFEQMWAGFDPRAEPLETETLLEWEEDDVLLRIVRFRIGVFKGRPAKLAAIYGVPKSAVGQGKKLPGLVQIHGGGQYADYKACLMNAKRGYATVSIAWAGRISAPNHRVSPNEVKLFWEGATDDPRYRLTTDWGAVDGYHAPSRNPRNNFPSARPAEWTVDEVESPRNSPWFLCAIAARRALTFMEQQPEVNADKLGVYGHSMGGKLTVMTSVDPRVKAAAPSCGGISDRDNASELFKTTIGDNVSLKEVSCPIIFQSPANDFHGRIGDLPRAVEEIQSKQWRVTCSPHHNHQDTAPFEVASLLWFDQHLKDEFAFPQTPEIKLSLASDDGVPTIDVQPDTTREILAIVVYYTQHGKDVELPSDHTDTVSRFWRHSDAILNGDAWEASLPLTTVDKPLWVYANVTYQLDEPVSGAGYYYGLYTAGTFNVSSLLEKVSPEQLKAAGGHAALQPSLMIETFEDGWEKEWFSYKPKEWPRSTNKPFDEQYRAPENASLAFEVRCEQTNELVVMIDGHAAVVEIDQTGAWKNVVLTLADFRDFEEKPLASFSDARQLKLSDTERLRATKLGSSESKTIGRRWNGQSPVFRNLRWVPRK